MTDLVPFGGEQGRRPRVLRRPAALAAAAAAVVLLAAAVAAVTLAGGAGHPLGSHPAGAHAARAKAAVPPPVVTLTPADGTGGVPLDARVRVAVKAGELRSVTVARAGGGTVAGHATGPRAWVSGATLAPGARYQVTVEVVDGAGRASRRLASFATLTPTHTLKTSIMPLDGQRVGVGLPIVVWLNRPARDPAAKAAVERRLEVDSDPPVLGAWHWFSATEVHWRPRRFWPSGTRVTVHADLAGLHLGGGTWGVADRTVRFTVGDRRVSVVNVNSHQMTVTLNGKVLRTLPVSTGRDKYPTTNGIHFVVEKTQDELMDSATVGIPRDSPDGYYEHVFWSVRISDSGEFVHAAPWSVGAQGHANVSHGCVNLSTPDAQWFYGFAQPGDIVQVVGSPKRPGGSFGVADWNMSWSRWLAGSALQSS